jgi:hypothetical protein
MVNPAISCSAAAGTLLILALSGCQQQAAELVLQGGMIYTIRADQPIVEAIVVSAGKIVFVGDEATAATYIGSDTEVVDLEGRLLLPGLIDAHLHPLGGAVKELYQCNFPFSADPELVRETIADCVENRPEAVWITGGQWDSGFFERFEMLSPRSFLDEVSGDAAILLSDDSGHNAWVNSKALELAKVFAVTPDPTGGTIVREQDGTPNGILLETAQNLVFSVVPRYSDKQFVEAARWFSDYANAYGITAAKAAAIEEDEMAGLVSADTTGELNVHMATSIRTPYGHRSTPLDYDEIDRIRNRYASEHVHTEFVKIFLDGVPTPARTAAMLGPYLPDEAHGNKFSGGALHVGLETLANDLIELDKRGYTVKMHAAGDRSVQVGLNAIEIARQTLGNSEKRHELAHAGFIHPDDIPRFAQLNAVADLCPILWHPSPIIDAVVSAVGERGQQYWPTRDLLDAKAPILAGSDWPSAVPNANPWPGVEAFVTRRDPRGNAKGSLWPEQAILLEEAIEIYTMHGARAMKMEDRIGSLEVGKLADLIVLERNIFEIPIDEVADTKIHRTYFEGKLVYKSN